jgi:FkbM family methyltransferase
MAALTRAGSALRAILRPFNLYVCRLPAPNSLEQHLRDVLALQSINTVLDVGAHYGEYRKLLRQIGFGGRIISFEPVASSFEILKASSENDPDWTGFAVALGESTCDIEMHVYSASNLNSILRASDYGRQTFKGGLDEVGVQTVRPMRLDDLFSELDLSRKRVLLKLDTQGRDLAVMEGARESLPFIAAIQSELAASSLYDGMTTMSRALDSFSSLGFSPSGFFPVVRDPGTMAVIEWDCVMTRSEPGSSGSSRGIGLS